MKKILISMCLVSLIGCSDTLPYNHVARIKQLCSEHDGVATFKVDTLFGSLMKITQATCIDVTTFERNEYLGK